MQNSKQYGIFEQIEFLNEGDISKDRVSFELIDPNDVPSAFKELAKSLANAISESKYTVGEIKVWSDLEKPKIFNIKKLSPEKQVELLGDSSRVYYFQFCPRFEGGFLRAVTGIPTFKHNSDALRFANEIFTSIGFEKYGEILKGKDRGYYYALEAKDNNGDDCIFVGWIAICLSGYTNSCEVYLKCLTNKTLNRIIINGDA